MAWLRHLGAPGAAGPGGHGGGAVRCTRPHPGRRSAELVTVPKETELLGFVTSFTGGARDLRELHPRVETKEH